MSNKRKVGFSVLTVVSLLIGSLLLAVSPVAAVDTDPTNDTCSGADPITVGTTTGNIVTGDNDDYYWINIADGDRVQMTLTPQNGLLGVDIDLYLEYGGCPTTMQRASSKNSGWGTIETIDTKTWMADKYYIDLYSCSLTCGIGSYTLSLTITDVTPPTYTLDSSDASGTTGEPFLFKLSGVYENHAIATSTVEYWIGTGSHTTVPITPAGGGAYSTTVTMPANGAGTLSYFFKLTDTAGLSNTTSTYTETITDNDAPVLGADTTPTSTHSGENIQFAISATDNIAITEATVEYWYGSGLTTTKALTGASGTYTMAIGVANTTDALSYRFKFKDAAGNSNTSTTKQIAVTDVAKPVFGADTTASTTTTGATIPVSVEVTDNVGLEEVTLDHWQGTGAHTVDPMTASFGDSKYTASLVVPTSSIDSIYYIVHAKDKSGNEASTTQKEVKVSDNVPPAVVSDTSEKSATTGDDFFVLFEASDNIPATLTTGTQTVEYWIGGNAHNTVTAALVTATATGGKYKATVPVPSTSVETLHYVIHLIDGSSNKVSANQADVTVSDNDAPTITNPAVTPAELGYGGKATFTASAADNIGVDGVYVEYWSASDVVHQNTSMTGSGSQYTFQTAGIKKAGAYTYIIHAKDKNGNWGASTQGIFSVKQEKKTPGFEMVPLVAAIAIALLATIRKRKR
jgi:hypothetical protein